MSIRKITTLAIFTTLALIIYSVESTIPPLIPVPGIKLGLANIITLVILQLYSPKDTFWVFITRVFLSTFLFGQAMSLLYSLTGGIFCFLAMVLINRLLHQRFLYLTSIVGALAHNMGQLLIAYLLTAVPGVLVYTPFLLISGVVTGLFTGLCAFFTLKYLLPKAFHLPSSPKSDGGN